MKRPIMVPTCARPGGCAGTAPITRYARVAAAGALLCVAGLGPRAAAAQSPEHDAAFAVLVRLFDGMRTRDTSAMRAAFVPTAVMQTITDTTVRVEPVDGWMRSVARAPAGLVLDERLANPVVHVDGNLASIWVDYWFLAGDRLSHCGVDAFLLAKHQGVWRVFSVVDTRRTNGCPAPPARAP